MTEAYAWVEGRVVPLGQARVALLDRGHLMGDGVFETFRAQAGRVLHRERHERRLARALALLGRPAAATDAWRAVDDLLLNAPTEDLNVRVQVTTGLGQEFAGDPARYAVTAIARPFQPYPPRAYDPGLALTVSMHRKAAGPFSSVKTLSFLAHVAARREALAQGADDAILLNDAGRVCEATTSNVFAVVAGNIHAPGPAEGAVEGVVRELLVEAFERGGATLRDRLAVEDLSNASEVFLTNTVAGVVPVRSVSGRPLAGPDGPVLGTATAGLKEADAADQARGFSGGTLGLRARSS